MIKSRHKARSLALQELYSMGVQATVTPSVFSTVKSEDELFTFLREDERKELDPTLLAYATFIVNYVVENFEDINAKILAYSRGRSLDRIAPVDLAILRLSIATLLFDKDTHPSIVIDEAVKLSSSYSNEVNFRFINGVLDSFVKENIKTKSTKGTI